MGKPLIGVLPLYDREKESYWMLPGYMKGIEDAGGIPVMLSCTADDESIIKLTETFDGFLFTGGQDIHPKLYGEEIDETCGEICAARDVMEAKLFQQVMEMDKPAFGICRGLQLFNALLGGTLYQDLPTQFKQSSIYHKQQPPYNKPAHDVAIIENTLLYQMLQADKIKVNSYHHQGIKHLSAQLVPAAIAADGLIEAAVMPDRTCIFAVQWHPEFNYISDIANFRLFREFVILCKNTSVMK